MPDLAQPEAKQKPSRIIALSGACLLLLLAVLLAVLPADATIQAANYTFLAFRAHPYARVTALGFSLLGAGGMLYASTGILSPAAQAVALSAVLSAIAVIKADNLLSFFIFWEMLAWLTLLLVVMDQKLTRRLLATTFAYLLTHLVGGLMLLVGFARQYALTGSMALNPLEAGAIPFALIAVGIKAAFIPLNYWIPAAYPEATYPASVFLSGLSTKVGVLAIVRLLHPHPAIAYMGGAMALLGVVFALLQVDMRRLLSWHIVSQVGYMVACMAWGTPQATDAGLLHVFNHILYKGALFMAAGCVIRQTATENLKSLSQRYSVSFLVTASALVAALSISGAPPFNGFVSKTLIKYAIEDPLLSFMLLVASVGTAASFTKFMYLGFLSARKNKNEPGRRLPLGMQLGLGGLAGLCLVTGLFPQSVKGFLPYASSIPVYRVGSILPAVVSLVGGIVAFTLASWLLPRIPFLAPPLKFIRAVEWWFTNWFLHDRFTHALQSINKRVLAGSQRYERLEQVGLAVVMVAVSIFAILWIILLH